MLIINPLCFAVLELANGTHFSILSHFAQTVRTAHSSLTVLSQFSHCCTAIARRRNTPGPGEPIGCLFLCRQVLLPTLSNPVVFCVGLGLLANVTAVPIPTAVADALDTLGASFSSLALFCLGLSMADSGGHDDDDSDEADSDGGGAIGPSDTDMRSARM